MNLALTLCVVSKLTCMKKERKKGKIHSESQFEHDTSLYKQQHTKYRDGTTTGTHVDIHHLGEWKGIVASILNRCDCHMPHSP